LCIHFCFKWKYLTVFVQKSTFSLFICVIQTEQTVFLIRLIFSKKFLFSISSCSFSVSSLSFLFYFLFYFYFFSNGYFSFIFFFYYFLSLSLGCVSQSIKFSKGIWLCDQLPSHRNYSILIDIKV